MVWRPEKDERNLRQMLRRYPRPRGSGRAGADPVPALVRAQVRARDEHRAAEISGGRVGLHHFVYLRSGLLQRSLLG